MGGLAVDVDGRRVTADVEPVLAASVILLRGEAPFEVLMIRRSEKSSFVPGAWVFPGGTVDPSDRQAAAQAAPAGDPHMAALRICALRELLEEAGVWPGDAPDNLMQLRSGLLSGVPALEKERHLLAGSLDRLVWTSRWITPAGVPMRFDTYFFLAQVAPGSAAATPDDHEAVELAWVTPQSALDLHHKGSFPMVFPTVKNLEAIRSAASATALIDSRRGERIPTHQPIIVENDGRKVIVLPG